MSTENCLCPYINDNSLSKLGCMESQTHNLFTVLVPWFNTPFPPPSRHLSAVTETNELGRDPSSHAAVFTWSILFYMRVVQKYEQNAVYIWNNRQVFGCIGKLTCRSSRISKYLSMLYFRLTRNVIYKRLFIFVTSAQRTWRVISGSKNPNPLISLE